MDPITKSIDKLEEVLGHSPHPAIIGLPIGAWTVSNLADGLYLMTGNDAYDDTAHVSMAIGLVGAAGEVVTGLRDYGSIPKERQPNHEIATTHALGNAVVSSLFLTSYIMRTRDRAAGYETGLAPPARDGRRSPLLVHRMARRQARAGVWGSRQARHGAAEARAAAGRIRGPSRSAGVEWIAQVERKQGRRAGRAEGRWP